MWHEVHAPKSLDECCTSTIKINELTTWMVREGVIPALPPSSVPTATKKGDAVSQPLHAKPHQQLPPGMRQCLLLHGPPGVGKLALIHAWATHHSIPIRLLHGTESNVGELQSFLADAFAEHKNERQSLTPSGSVKPKKCIYVVKELPLDTPRQLASVLGRFLSLLSSRHGQELNGVVVFAHTVHDTHSEKVELRQFYSSQFVESAFVHAIRLPPLTEMAVLRRVKAVLHAEKRRGDENFLKQIALVSHGDIRQALLQLQWISLIPTIFISPLATEFRDVQKGPSRPPPPTPAAKTTTSSTKKTGNTAASRGGASAKPLISIEDDDIIQCSSDDEGPPLKRGAGATGRKRGREDDSVESKQTPPPSQTKTPSQGISKTASTSTASYKPAKPAADILSLMDEVPGIIQGNLPQAATTTSSKPSVATPAIELLLQRDDCIDVAHAAARLLIQKYSTQEVLDCLSAESTKLLGYVVNNMHYYFSANQLVEYAQCMDAASRAEASAKPESDEALICFNAAYRGFHKDVVVPKDFVPHYPPKWIRPSYPRLTDRNAATWREQAPRADRTIGDGLGVDFDLTAAGPEDLIFVLREVLAPSLCPLRSLSGAALLEDYASFATQICLSREVPRLTGHAKAVSASAPQSQGPARTLLQPSASLTATAPTGRTRTLLVPTAVKRTITTAEQDILQYVYHTVSSKSSTSAAGGVGGPFRRPYSNSFSGRNFGGADSYLNRGTSSAEGVTVRTETFTLVPGNTNTTSGSTSSGSNVDGTASDPIGEFD